MYTLVLASRRIKLSKIRLVHQKPLYWVIVLILYIALDIMAGSHEYFITSQLPRLWSSSNPIMLTILHAYIEAAIIWDVKRAVISTALILLILMEVVVSLRYLIQRYKIQKGSKVLTSIRAKPLKEPGLWELQIDGGLSCKINGGDLAGVFSNESYIEFKY
jgi:hypothetical protein